MHGTRSLIQAHGPTCLHVYRRVANLEAEQLKTDEQLTKLERLLEQLEAGDDKSSEIGDKLEPNETP